MRKHCAVMLATWLALGAQDQLDAAAGPSGLDQTITVTGERLKKSEARKRAYDFISLTTATRMNQFGRRTMPICPRTIGIDPSYATIVESKIRMIAQTVGVAQASADCAANMFILFTDDAKGLMATLRKAKPVLFANVPPNEQRALFAGAAPMRWWHGNDVANSEGGTIVSGTDEKGIEGSVSDIKSSSLIDTKIKISITDSVVVVDVNLSRGYPLEAIASYAAMVSLAQIMPDKGFDRLPSILSLFSQGPDSTSLQRDLTRFDVAYLKSIYEFTLNRERHLQKNQIASRMANRLANPAP